MTRSVVSRFSVSEFNLTFSWERSEKLQPDRPEGSSVEPVFYVLEKESPEYSLKNEIITQCLHNGNNGLVLSKPPLPDNDGPPCDMSFLVKTQDHSYCAAELTIVSEARNLELFVNRMYENTSKGSRIRPEIERPETFYHCSMDLSDYCTSGKVAKLKFVSMADKQQLKILAVIFGVSRFTRDNGPTREMMLKALNPSAVDLDQVKSMLSSMTLNLPTNAEKLMGEIDRQQQIQAAQLQHVLALGSTINQTHIERLRWDGIRRSQEDKQKDRLSDMECPSDGKQLQGLTPSLVGENFRSETGSSGIYAKERQPRADGSAKASSPKFGQTGQGFANLSKPNESETTEAVDRDAIEDGESFCDLLSTYLKKLDTTETRGRSQSDGSKAVDRWEAYLRSRIRATQRMNSSPDCMETREISNHEHSHGGGNGKRCTECGCPGCATMYNSILTDMQLMEERILTKLENRIQETLSHIDQRFETLQQLLVKNQKASLTHHVFDIGDRPEAEMEEAECVDGVYKSEV